jgi:hypothetical protein
MKVYKSYKLSYKSVCFHVTLCTKLLIYGQARIAHFRIVHAQIAYIVISPIF